MQILLGGVELNPSLFWEDRYQSFSVAQTMNRTIGGKSVLYTSNLRGGRKITFKGTHETGWLPKSTADLLMGMASAAGATFQLIITESGTSSIDATGYILPPSQEIYDVVFRHNEPPALDLQPLVSRAVQSQGDYFYGTIKLLTL